MGQVWSCKDANTIGKKMSPNVGTLRRVPRHLQTPHGGTCRQLPRRLYVTCPLHICNVGTKLWWINQHFYRHYLLGRYFYKLRLVWPAKFSATLSFGTFNKLVEQCVPLHVATFVLNPSVFAGYPEAGVAFISSDLWQVFGRRKFQQK